MKKKSKARKERRRRKEIGTHSNLNEWRKLSKRICRLSDKNKSSTEQSHISIHIYKVDLLSPHSSLTHPPPPPAVARCHEAFVLLKHSKFTYNWIEKNAPKSANERIEREMWAEKWMKSIKSYCLQYFFHSFIFHFCDWNYLFAQKNTSLRIPAPWECDANDDDDDYVSNVRLTHSWLAVL